MKHSIEKALYTIPTRISIIMLCVASFLAIMVTSVALVSNVEDINITHLFISLAVFAPTFFLTKYIRKLDENIVRPNNTLYSILHEKTDIIDQFITQLITKEPYANHVTIKYDMEDDEFGIFDASDVNDIIENIKDVKKHLKQLLQDEGLSYLFFEKMNTLEMQDFITKLKAVSDDKGLVTAFSDKSITEQHLFLNPLLSIIDELFVLKIDDKTKNKKLKEMNFTTKEIIIENTKKKKEKELDDILNNNLLKKEMDHEETL